MTKIPVKNTTEMPLYVGASMVPPGETRHFPAHQVPAYLRPKAEAKPEQQAPSALTAILDKSIKEIVPMLPTYSSDELQELKAAEIAGKTRDGLMKAFAEEELRRANEQVDNPGDASKGGEDGGESAGEDDSTGE